MKCYGKVPFYHASAPFLKLHLPLLPKVCKQLVLSGPNLYFSWPFFSSFLGHHRRWLCHSFDLKVTEKVLWQSCLGKQVHTV